jgi:GT2 family glycosyltransferase
MINLCFPVLSNYAGLANAINSACEGKVKPDNIIVIDNGGNFTELFGELNEINGVKLSVFFPEENLGVTKSWNYFLNLCDDYVIISNDDVVFKQDTLKLLVEAADKNPNEIFFCPECYWEHEYSLFLLRKSSLETVGSFDENWFVYFSDQDHKYRMKLKGYKPFWVKNCTYEHAEGGSQTSRNVVTSGQFAKDLEYYKAKWNGVPRCEKYLTPFNQ